MKLKVTLTRSPALREYGPEETNVLQAQVSFIHFNYNLFMVNDVDGSEIEIGQYNDEIGGWRVYQGRTATVWSDVRIEPTE